MQNVAEWEISAPLDQLQTYHRLFCTSDLPSTLRCTDTEVGKTCWKILENGTLSLVQKKNNNLSLRYY